ncbi:hypothetical protein MGN01_26040 [Methylobacterium gnaphalii]|uniref:Uncharacterized protein n=1 Tax=Methylobacterium gnaphalii TaxID=1010610 RepID=A0A512JLC3_9HYPH|nr:hypothetical protein MGN01_26040 [Methylobacterium gnaphalii]
MLDEPSQNRCGDNHQEDAQERRSVEHAEAFPPRFRGVARPPSYRSRCSDAEEWQTYVGVEERADFWAPLRSNIRKP